jgi:adenine-specific DNA glycosylase
VQAIVSKHGGVVPNNFEDLEDLPGMCSHGAQKNQKLIRVQGPDQE